MNLDHLLVGALGTAAGIVVTLLGVLARVMIGKRNGRSETAGDKDPAYWHKEFAGIQANLNVLGTHQAAAIRRMEETVQLIRDRMIPTGQETVLLLRDIKELLRQRGREE